MKYIGYYKNNEYQDFFGNKITCFKCNSNKCVGSKSFHLSHGGHGELLHCEKHEKDIIEEVEKRNNNVTIYNCNSSHS